MQVVKPNTISSENVISNTLVDLNEDWSAATTYDEGDLVTYENRTYESLQGSNLNRNPVSSPTWWIDAGPSNSWALLDEQVSTQSVAPDEFTIVFTPGAIDTVAVLNVVASFVRVTVRDETGGTVVFDEEQSLDGDIVLDWYQYFFFDQTSQRTLAVFRNIPLFPSCEVTIHVEIAGGSDVAVGQIVAGQISDLGQTQYGMAAGIIDFSRKETDEEFGTTQFTIRSFSKRMSPTVYIDNRQLNRVQRTLYQLRAIPTLWLATGDPTLEEISVVYGFYRDFQTEIAGPTYSICTLEIEGLI